jgi:chloramphenicol-sensitive protein RarD
MSDDSVSKLNSGTAEKTLPEFVTNPAIGYFSAMMAQLIWGFFPFFYSFLRSVDSLELVAHRCIWGFFFVMLWMGFFRWMPGANQRPVQEFRWVIKQPKILGLICLAAFFSGMNWIAFVWAVTHQRALEASLGYFICPQVHVLLGVLILRERLNGGQTAAILISALGVGYIAAFSNGIPWVGIFLALAFGFYGLVKKKIPLSAPPGLLLETGVMLLPALSFLVYSGLKPGHSLIASPGWLNILLVMSGFLTVAPLAFYGTALRHIPLSTVGLLQFFGPSLQFFCGVYLLGEDFDLVRLVGFIFVWIGLAVFLLATARASASPRVHPANA